MKTLFLIYDEALDTEVAAILRDGMVVTRYSRIDRVKGARMLENDYSLDRRNRLIMVMGDEKTIAKLVAGLKALRNRAGHGLRGFVVPAEEVI